MTQSLSQEFDALANYGALKSDIPDDITGSLRARAPKASFAATAELQSPKGTAASPAPRPKRP